LSQILQRYVMHVSDEEGTLLDPEEGAIVLLKGATYRCLFSSVQGIEAFVTRYVILTSSAVEDSAFHNSGPMRVGTDALILVRRGCMLVHFYYRSPKVV
jgi:hypothetical protein